jgi:putative FmdB family regulatory protein
MPLFDYTCHKCDSEFELLLRSNETPVCPKCGSRELEKHLGAPAAHTAGASQLPVCDFAPPGGCGMPQCGMGRCGMA